MAIDKCLPVSPAAGGFGKWGNRAKAGLPMTRGRARSIVLSVLLISAGLGSATVLLKPRFEDDARPLSKEDRVASLPPSQDSVIVPPIADHRPASMTTILTNEQLAGTLRSIDIRVRRMQEDLVALDYRLRSLEEPIESEPDPPLTKEEAERQVQIEEDEEAERIQAEQAALNAAYEAEIADQEWAVQTTSDIEGVIAGAAEFAATVVGLDCRATLCRIEIDAKDRPSSEVASELSREIGAAQDQPMAGAYITDADGRTVLFLVRDGYELPSPP